TATPARYPLSLHDALPICGTCCGSRAMAPIAASSRRRGASSPTTCSPFPEAPRVTLRRPHADATIAALVGRAPSTRSADGDLRRSEEHTSELQSPDHLVCR